MVDQQATPAKEWRRTTPITVPSGNVCLIKKIGLQTFVSMGVVPNSLVPMLMQNSQPSSREITDLLTSKPERIKEFMALLNEVTLACVVEPKLSQMPKCGECGERYDHHNHPVFMSENGHPYLSEERDPEKFYVDEVDEDDKAFIFQAAVMGGTTDVERFRQEQNAVLESLSEERRVQDSPEPVAVNTE